jgi:hypothetical protein
LEYEVRTNKTFAVTGGTSGFLHDVITAAQDHRCERGRNGPFRGRAFAGFRFQNGLVSFKIGVDKEEAGDDEGDGVRQVWEPGLALQVDVGNIPKLAVSLGNVGSPFFTHGTLPVELRYDPITQTLFAIDIALRGLVLVPVTPSFPSSLSGVDYVN